MGIRRAVIALLIIADAAIACFYLFGLKEAEYNILPENVTIHKNIEQAGAMEHPDFIKEEYVLTLPEGENIALGKKVKASSFNDVYTARKAVDGVAAGVSYWEGKSDYPNTLMIDLEEPAPIHAVRVCLSPMSIWGKRTQTFGVYISDDGENFTELYPVEDHEFNPDTGNEIQFNFDEITTRYVQLEFTGNTGAGGGQVAELEIYSGR